MLPQGTGLKARFAAFRKNGYSGTFPRGLQDNARDEVVRCNLQDRFPGCWLARRLAAARARDPEAGRRGLLVAFFKQSWARGRSTRGRGRTLDAILSRAEAAIS